MGRGQRGDHREGDCQRNVFFETIGPEYVDLAFRFAREADPNAKLYYNDYDAEVINPQSDAILRMVAGMRARGVPINGVGFQGHFFGGQPDAEAVAANLDRFADLGLEIQFTEVDMPDYSDDPSAPERRQLQADSYRTIAGVCRLEPACQRSRCGGSPTATPGSAARPSRCRSTTSCSRSPPGTR